MGKYSFRLFLRDVIKYQDGFTPEGLSRFIGDEARIFIVNSKGGFIQNIKDVIAAFLKERAWQAA